MINLPVQARRNNSRLTTLRAKGEVPGVFYGSADLHALVKAKQNELKKAFTKTGGIYRIKTKTGYKLAKMGEIQEDPVTRELIHFSLVEMPKGEENELEVPVDLVGEAEGTKKGGTIVVLKDHVMMQGTPSSMPTRLEAKITGMDIGDKITIDDLKIPKNVSTTEDTDEVIAICKPPVKQEEDTESEIIDLEPTLPPSASAM